MNKFLFIIQLLLKAFLIFLIAFVWLRFFLDKLWLAIVISSAVTIIILLLSLAVKSKNNQKKYLKQKEKENAIDMFFSLANDKNYLTFFENLAKIRHQNASKKKSYILITHFDQSKTILYPILKFKLLTLDDINLSFINCKKEKAQKLVICCNDYEKELISSIKSFPIEILILDKFDSYLMLYKEYEFYPEITIKSVKERKMTFKELLAYAFNRSRTKGYLIAAFFISLTSFFVQINIYYCIFSSLLLLLALISYINPKYNSFAKKELL